MISVLYNYLDLNISIEEFKNQIEIITSHQFKYNNKYYFILSLVEVADFYKNFRSMCESEINAHIDKEFRPYINYAKYYADKLYESEEYKILESMDIIDNKYKIGIFDNYDYKNSLQ